MKLLKSLYFNLLFFFLIGSNVVFYILAFFFPFLLLPASFTLVCLLIILSIDIAILYRMKAGIEAGRICSERFSNGDENQIVIKIKNKYPFTIKTTIIDEIPFQFQKRDFEIHETLKSGHDKEISYSLRPVKRGEYNFGSLNIYAQSPFRLIKRKYMFDGALNVKVYPSFLQMHKYELLAFTDKLRDQGIKKLRKLGHNLEFEQIRDYSLGDDIRSINWRATARKGHLMVNQYQDEKAQDIYSIIDKGRTMKMPFNGMTLLDYSINSSLVMSNIAMKKDDKAGLAIFSNKVTAFVKADRVSTQLNTISETLYKEKTAYPEHDFASLYVYLSRKISRRSLLMIYTNFEGITSARRQLSYLKKLSSRHLVVVIFFENTELSKVVNATNSASLEEIYTKTIAEKFLYEKRQITIEFQKYGIYTIYTSPEALTVNTINKYLELKSRNLI
ncbi:hypothetical protein MYP_4470 [Sporocytophaga myxococcoides]|uniref:DUF58 domain-containing protein n=1 Tax=Sporocytophaga myxococcoides TaxID=153721 RepID=A0A098LJY7_9BACT|nr:DUF58 domain-containing protein [Sporocytophaga myxococcoides]GAL87240.1 hypothetical protein MYP_4470 [Sporocytophaga myxococcoides]